MPASLQAEALGVGDGDGELELELLPGPVRRQTDLVEAGVGDGEPEETQTEEGDEGGPPAAARPPHRLDN